MKKINFLIYQTIIFSFCFLGSSVFSAGIPDKNNRQKDKSALKLAGTPNYQILNINNITTWMRADGQQNHSPTRDNGSLYPRGTKSVIYQDGFVWGGKAYLDAGLTTPAPTQLIRIGGQTYLIGTRAGRVIGTGATAVAQSPSDPDVRIFRIRRDYAEMVFQDLQRDAAESFEIPIANVTSSHIEQIFNQYAYDWDVWPVAYGAPYIERNGIPGYQKPKPFNYDITMGPIFNTDSLIAGNYDEPGLAGANPNFPADQVIWTVMNDLDRAATTGLYGSEPLGLEAQITLWGYKSTDAMGNLYFKKIKFINKGGVDIGGGAKGSFYIDSMFFAQWSDADIGSYGDDLCGVDMNLFPPVTGKPNSLGFAYNGNATDGEFNQFNLPPPAVGYDFLQGPLVAGAPTDSGIFNMRRVYGKKNLPMTSFAYFSTGSGIGDPPFSYEGGLRWWRMLQGYVPDPSTAPWRLFPHPPGITETKFPLNGDPVNGTGFIDGLGTVFSLHSGDRRLVLNTGPFSLAPGDTQEVVMATIGGIGADRLSSISSLKSTDRLAQRMYDQLFQNPPPKKILISQNYISQHLTEVTIIANAQGANATQIFVCFKKYDGISIVCDTLYDDGLHGDGLAGDQIFGNFFQIVPQSEGLYLDAKVTYNTGQAYNWSGIVENISTAGPVSVINYSVASDNINNDGIVNPGENIRYVFSIENNSKFSFNNVQIIPTPNPEYNSVRITNLDSSSTFSLAYNPSDANSYFTFNVPSYYNDSTYKINIKIRDANYNLWQDTIIFSVKPFPSQIYGTPITHISGMADGDFEILIVNPSDLKNHIYVIRGVDSINTARERGFTLKDSTDGRILLLNHPLPNQHGHNIPVTDGFKVFKGTLNTDSTGVKGWEIPSGISRFTWLNANLANFEGFNGALGWASPGTVFPGGSGIKAVPKNVLLKLATVDLNGNYNFNDPNVSYGYRYGRAFTFPPAQPQFAPFIINQSGGYAYQDFTKSVPLSAWDIEANPPRRLVLGHLENNVVGGMVDGKYWPPDYNISSNAALSGPREWLWIFDATYSETPNPAFQVEAISNPLPIMYFATWARNGSVPFATGDEFLITAYHIISTNDVWIFNPTVMGIKELDINSYQLYQNYPNPFNPNTSISYQLPTKSFVKLKIFNILGQEIITLIDELQDEGHKSVIWNGRNKSGNAIASGVYFYKIDALSVNDPNNTFVQVRKMILLK